MTGGHHLAAELGETLKLAVPIALTQLGQIAMMTTDIALIGRFGSEAVAAASLAQHRLLRQLHLRHGPGVGGGAAGRAGVRRPQSASRPAIAARRPVGCAVDRAADDGAVVPRRADPADAGSVAGRRPPGAGIPARADLEHPARAVVSGDPRLHERGQPAGADPVDHAGRDPGQRACWSICCCTAHSACRSSDCSAPGSRPPSSISAPSWRRCGLPRAAVRSGNFTCSDTSGASTGSLMRQLVVIGAPISISFLLEYGLFGAAGLLMGVISTTALAAHQIALQVAAVLFMVPFGISIAATVRVGHAIGRRDAERRPPRRPGSDVARHRHRRRIDARRDARAGSGSRKSFSARAPTPRPNCPRRCCWSDRPSLSPTASRPSPPDRCAA